MGSKLSPPEKAHIEEVIESAMRDYISSQTKFIKNREELVNRVTGIVSEYLSPFILIGYDTKGQPINIVQASSQLDADALSTAVNKLIFNND
jgi:hypothetical protein